MNRFSRSGRAALLFAAVACAACARPDATIIERELYGRWQTDAPRYAGRGFTIDADSITLHHGPGVDVAYAIEKIRRTPRATHAAYVVTYRTVAGRRDFMLEYRASEESGEVVLPNQPRVIWKQVPVIGSTSAH